MAGTMAGTLGCFMDRHGVLSCISTHVLRLSAVVGHAFQDLGTYVDYRNQEARLSEANDRFEAAQERGWDSSVMRSTMDQIKAATDRARNKHPQLYSSTHEAYALLKEESEEWWDLIKAEQTNRRMTAEMVDELLDIAAVIVRAIEELT